MILTENTSSVNDNLV